MTAGPAKLPPWAQPYEPDFRELLRQLDLVPGFIFQPVVLPSPDLARALADWLAAGGIAVRVFDMRSEPWDDLAARLLGLTFDPAAERRAVVVITPIELDRAAIREGFLALNSVRDSLARTLQCPLLWCGGVDLLRATADYATDLWSIAATVYRIPLRALSDVRGHLGLPDVWWTGAVRDNTDDIAARLAAARARGDARATVQAGLDLAEAQLARDARSDAAETLATIKSSVQAEAPVLMPRWGAPCEAVSAAGTSPRDEIADLRAQIERARQRGAKHVEAPLFYALARLLYAIERTAEAFDALMSARALALDVGDDGAAAFVETVIVTSFCDRLSVEQIASIRAHAEDLSLRSGSSNIRRDAWWIRAALARHAQRWDEADDAASGALRESAPADVRRIQALELRRIVAVTRRDWTAAAARASELLEFSLAHDLLAAAMDAYRGRAVASSALGRHHDACRDLNAARSLAARMGDHANEATGTLDLSLAARRLGALQVHAALMARAFEGLVHLEATPLPAYEDALRSLGDHELADILAAAAGDPAARSAAIDRLTAIADSREQALRARGVDLSDPDTWPVDAPALDVHDTP